ncbi:hypothetical protein CF328_g6867 [Tilletia controversa]|nr:hypothetical protein CF328_g6867 [Tilletia controversa]
MPVVVTLFRSGRTEGQPFTLDENNFAAKLMAGPPYQRSAAAYVFLHQDLPHISPISDKHDIFLNGRHLFSRHPLDSARLHNDDSIQIHTHPPFSFEEEHLIAVELDATIPPISARSPSPSPLPAPHSTSSTSAPTAPSFSSAQGHIAPSSHSRDCSLDDTAPPTFSYAAFVTPRPCSAPSISLTPSTPNMPSPGLGNTSGLTAVPAAISPASSSGPSSSSGLTSVLASNSSAASSSIILTTPAERFCAPTSHTSRPEYREPSTPSPHAQTTAACTQPCTTSLSYSAHAMVVSSSTSSTTLADSGSTSALDGALQSAVNETTDAIGGGRPTFHIGRYGGQRDVQHIPTNHARHSSVSDATRARTAEIAVGRVRTAWLEARQVGTTAHAV